MTSTCSSVELHRFASARLTVRMSSTSFCRRVAFRSMTSRKRAWSAVRPTLPFAEQLEVADDRRERRSQLVRDHRHERLLHRVELEQTLVLLPRASAALRSRSIPPRARGDGQPVRQCSSCMPAFAVWTIGACIDELDGLARLGLHRAAGRRAMPRRGELDVEAPQRMCRDTRGIEGLLATRCSQPPPRTRAALVGPRGPIRS